jgi:hypothetical protein
LRDFRGRPFTGADPGAGTVTERGILLPAPASGVGGGKVSIDAESLQFTRDGGFYVGDEYAANVYYFDKRGRLRGVLQPPTAIAPYRDGQPYFGSLQAPDTGRRNNQGVEGMSLAPDGHTLFVALQSALMQDSATGNAAGRTDIRVLAYDVRGTPTPARPVAHYVVQLPAYNNDGNGGAPNRTAAQSEIRALRTRRPSSTRVSCWWMSRARPTSPAPNMRPTSHRCCRIGSARSCGRASSRPSGWS